eukprot:SAG11_NODE_2068_length_3864_cov_6.492430_2_plen_60_part_00
MLLPNGAAAGQEIEFAVPTAPPAASADSSQAVDEAKAVHDAQRRVRKHVHLSLCRKIFS